MTDRPYRPDRLPAADEQALLQLEEGYQKMLQHQEERDRGPVSSRLHTWVARFPQADKKLLFELLGGCCVCLILLLLSMRFPPGRTVEASYPSGRIAASSSPASITRELPPDGSFRVAVNLCDAQALTAVPGIGPALAEKIIAQREENGCFHYPEDLLSVSGIGKSTLEKILPYLSLELPADPSAESLIILPAETSPAE